MLMYLWMCIFCGGFHASLGPIRQRNEIEPHNPIEIVCYSYSLIFTSIFCHPCWRSLCVLDWKIIAFGCLAAFQLSWVYHVFNKGTKNKYKQRCAHACRWIAGTVFKVNGIQSRSREEKLKNTSVKKSSNACRNRTPPEWMEASHERGARVPHWYRRQSDVATRWQRHAGTAYNVLEFPNGYRKYSREMEKGQE